MALYTQEPRAGGSTACLQLPVPLPCPQQEACTDKAVEIPLETTNRMSATSIPAKLLREAKEATQAKESVTKLERERAVLRERSETLEARCTELEAAREAAGSARFSAVEALSVAQAERKLLEDTVGRADALVGELRAERSALLARVDRLEAERSAAQGRCAESEEARRRAQEALAVEQVERRSAAEHLDHATAQLSELRAVEMQQRHASDERLAALQGSLKAAYDERASLQEACSVAQAERRMLDEKMASASTLAGQEQASLRDQLAAAEQRCAEARAAQGSLLEERSTVQSALTVAQAEKRLLQDLTSRLQQMQLEERAVSAAARERADALHAELAARFEASEASLRSAREQLGSLDADRRTLAERCTHLDAQLKMVQGDHGSMAAERRQLDERVRRQDAQLQQLQLERAASHSLEERFRDMQTQRDAAEAERASVQEEVAALHSRRAALEEAARGTEGSLKAVQAELDAAKERERERDERVREFQRQRDTAQRERARLQDQLAVVSADARSASEREHALFVRTTVLEQQLSIATSRAAESDVLLEEARAVHGGAAGGCGAAGGGGASPLPPTPAVPRGLGIGVHTCMTPTETPLPNIDQAIESIGAINQKWAPPPPLAAPLATPLAAPLAAPGAPASAAAGTVGAEGNGLGECCTDAHGMPVTMRDRSSAEH